MGKFGSRLCWTGKVRAMTPKVEKSNTKHEVTGRAKKRSAAKSLTKKVATEIKVFEQNEFIFNKKEVKKVEIRHYDEHNIEMYRPDSNSKKPHRSRETYRLQ
ncbi:RPS30 [Acrasis kona]|uniref:RPS30 n=1 Tax=Acrasis kona TaxID=1008807 RepID=A0AAW2YLV9_9EUKA